MNTTHPTLPPVYVTIPVQKASGRKWVKRLNGGITTAEASRPSEDLYWFRAKEVRAVNFGIIGGIAAVITIIFGATIGVPRLVRPATPAPDAIESMDLALAAIAGCIAVYAISTCVMLWKTINRRWTSAETATQPLLDSLIDIKHADRELRTLATQLDRERTKAINQTNPTPEVHAAYTQALNALVDYARQAIFCPDLDLARVASAKHLHDDPVVKVIAENQKATQKAKTAAYIAARTAIDHFTKTAEDPETLRIAHTAHAINPTH
jgi:hypothetical protein